MELNFIGGAYQGRSTNLNAQVCQNLFPVIDNQDGASVLSLMGTPGMKLWCLPGAAAEVRALLPWQGNLYAVVGNTLYQITSGVVATAYGTLGTSTGKVWIAGGTTDLCLVDGTDGYYAKLPGTVVTTTYQTTVGVAAVSGDTSLDVASTTSFIAGDTIKIVLDDDTVHLTTIVAVVDSDTVTLTAKMPGAAAIGNDVQVLHYSAVTSFLLTLIDDPDFPATPTSLAYQDGYFIVTEDGTDLFYISASEDSSSWDGLDFASAEDSPDDVLAVIRNNRELWMFGEDTIEVFYNSGDSKFPFTRISGGVIQVGCGASGSLASAYEGLFGLDNKFRVRMVATGNAEVISTPQIEYHISTYATKSDAIGFTYSLEGHSFYVITFPSANKTWVYDITTKHWHNWSSGLTGGRHRANCCAFFAEKHLVGDYANGTIYELDLGTYTDGGDTIRRVRAAQTVKSNLQRVFHSQLEIEFEAGIGLPTGMATLTAVLTGDAVSSVTIPDGGSGYTVAPQLIFSGGAGSGAVATATLTLGVITLVTVITGGSGYTSAPTITVAGGTQDPQAMLDWSDDGGHVWSNEHWTGIGAIGEYKHRAIWRRLGSSRQRVYRVTITDPVKVVIIGAQLQAAAGAS